MQIMNNELEKMYASLRSIHGGMTEVAARLGVRREWVWLVLTGTGKSQRVLEEVAKFIEERTPQNNKPA